MKTLIDISEQDERREVAFALLCFACSFFSFDPSAEASSSWYFKSCVSSSSTNFVIWLSHFCYYSHQEIRKKFYSLSLSLSRSLIYLVASFFRFGVEIGSNRLIALSSNLIDDFEAEAFFFQARKWIAFLFPKRGLHTLIERRLLISKGGQELDKSS